jgi:hypothetical protein
MNVKILKLVTGEEIIGEVEYDTGDTITLKNILAIMLQPTRDGMLSFGFIPWGSLVDGSIMLGHESIVYSGIPTQDVQNNYAEKFGGIVTPPKQLIV